jgi:hypothetical protein
VLHLTGAAKHLKDITGTIIRTSTPVALISGHSCAQVPVGVFYCDILMEMLPPISSLGTQYLVPPLPDRRRSTIRVISTTDNTHVSLNGKSVATINSGEYYENNNITSLSTVKTSKAVYVAEYAHSAEDDSEKISDPFMMVISPVNSFIHSVEITVPRLPSTGETPRLTSDHGDTIYKSGKRYLHVYDTSGSAIIASSIKAPSDSTMIHPERSVPTKVAISERYIELDIDPAVTSSNGWHNYITIVLKGKAVAPNDVRIDGVIKNVLFSQYGNYSLANILVTLGSHTITSSLPFSAYLSGYSTTFDSYGHLCGMQIH